MSLDKEYIINISQPDPRFQVLLTSKSETTFNLRLNNHREDVNK